MNTISKRLLLLSTLPVVVLILLAAGLTWHSKMQVMRLDARKLARAIARQALANRGHYARSVVDKLAGTPYAARDDSDAESPHVPLADTFVVDVAKGISVAQDEYDYKLVSLWNVNEPNALADPFLKRGFDNLFEQERRAKAAGRLSSEQNFTEWQPYYEIEKVDGVQHLRLVTADIATAASCVSCHNAIEQRPDIVARRKQAGGVAVDKTFELNDLMGAIAIDVNLEEAEVLAETTTASLLLWLVLGGAAACSLLVYFGRGFVLRPIQTLASSMEEAAVGDRDLTRRADETSGDEFGRLGRAHNTLLGRISRTLSRIAASAEEIHALATDDSADRARESTQALDDIASHASVLANLVAAFKTEGPGTGDPSESDSGGEWIDIPETDEFGRPRGDPRDLSKVKPALPAEDGRLSETEDSNADDPRAF